MKYATITATRLSDGSKREFAAPITEFWENPDGSQIPVLGIKMMSDEDWQRTAKENAIKNYTRKFGHAPATTEVAITWQRAYVEKIIAGKGGAVNE